VACRPRHLVSVSFHGGAILLRARRRAGPRRATRIDMPESAAEIGLAFITLSLVFAAAAVIRRWSPPLRALFIPTAVIGGFLVLALGPEGVGRLTAGGGLFSASTFAVWKALPGLLINVMCAALLLGERLPPLKTIWSFSGSHVIMAGIMSA